MYIVLLSACSILSAVVLLFDCDIDAVRTRRALGDFIIFEPGTKTLLVYHFGLLYLYFKVQNQMLNKDTIINTVIIRS